METWTNEMRTHTWNNKKYFWAHRTVRISRQLILKKIFLLTLVCVAYLHLSWSLWSMCTWKWNIIFSGRSMGHSLFEKIIQLWPESSGKEE